ncbi:MAG TPA: glycosyl hydrolase [Actinocrinis sp.]|nr:glycosyl hydrolase [Actinocrinis sp.]
MFAGVLLLGLLAAGADGVAPARLVFDRGAEPRVGSGVPFGAFLGSGTDGVDQIPAFDAWLAQGGAVDRMTVGHTYLPGDSWSAVEGDPDVLGPWTAWHRATPGSLLVVNVPLAAPNEVAVADAEVRTLLRRGAAGTYDAVFRTLAERLVSLGSGDAILIPAWEMNGVTYADRCAPDPEAWKAYWRRVVTVIRSVPGARFRFDFDPSRGVDDIPWPQCYPGDAYVDIIGMDSYDQPPGSSFGDYVAQPYGLAAQVEFATAHHKPVSYPEWGLYRYGDDSAFVSAMLAWIATHDAVYETITDYCPHGVFECADNPGSSRVYREAAAHR